MTFALVTLGTLLVVTALVDVVWTTVAAGSGAGPLSARVGRTVWAGALAVHRRRQSHAFLSVAGVAIALALLVLWILVVLTGWTLVFTASDGAVRTTDSGAPASFMARVYFVGYTVFTLGNGDYSPGDGTWQIATVLATGTGLILVTLSITYLVPVASAVAQRRQLASYIASLGTTPTEILTRNWTGSGFGSLSQHLVALTPLVHGARQRHLTYPVLHYFHSKDRESAAAPNIANLADALHLLRHGVTLDARADPAAVEPLDAAVGSFLETLASAFIHPAHDALPAPPLDPLRAAGIPTGGDAAYAEATTGTLHRRRLLVAFVRNDGWPIDERRTAVPLDQEPTGDEVTPAAPGTDATGRAVRSPVARQDQPDAPPAGAEVDHDDGHGQ